MSLALIMLALVIVVGVESGGAKRWLGYGEMSFQPTEMMKIALVLALARYYQWLPPNRVSWPHAVLPPLLMIGAPALLALDQPDLGTAALFGIVGGGLLFLAGVSWIYFAGALVGVIVVLPHVWERLHDYQKERILTFIDPERDPLGSGYHILQSKIAIGSGGLTGKGYMQGTQTQLNFLPEKHTDFIFTMFSEEMGFIGSVRPACALPSRPAVHHLYGAQMPQHLPAAGGCRHGTLPVRLCVHQRGDGDGAGAGGRRAAAAGLLRGHLDADHDDRPGLRAQRPCQPRDPHQAGGAWAVLVRLAADSGQAKPVRVRGAPLGAPFGRVTLSVRLETEGGL